MTTGFYTPGASHAPRNLIIPIYGHLCTDLEVVVPGGNPRSRGFPPKLSDAEALTMEFVGAFLGYHGDQAIGEYWRRHWAPWFPHLGDRSTFVRQLANLWQIKALLHPHGAGTLGAFEAPVHRVDGFPVPVCHPKRVSRHTVFRGEADWGFCASKDPYSFGFHALLLTTAEGVIAGVTLTAATSIDKRDSVFDLPLGAHSRGIARRQGLHTSHPDREDLSGMGIALPTPLRDHMRDSRPKSFVAPIVSVRRRIE